MVSCLKSYQSGVTLLEVMLAILILSISLLGAAKLQLTALKMNTQAYQKSVAATQLLSLIHRLKANSTHLSLEVKQWNQFNARLLPQGKGECVCQGSLCTITLTWHSQWKKQEMSTQYKLGT